MRGMHGTHSGVSIVSRTNLWLAANFRCPRHLRKQQVPKVQMSLRLARPIVPAFAACLLAVTATCAQAATDPLPSWNEGAAKARISRSCRP